MRTVRELRLAGLFAYLASLVIALLLSLALHLLLGGQGELGWEGFNAYGLLEGLLFLLAFTWSLALGQRATRIPCSTLLTAGLADIDCRFCHASVQVKKLGAPFTAVQWNTEAAGRCAFFAEVRADGGTSARVPSCPRLADSIRHAVAEGCLEEYSSSPPPGDG